MCCDLRGKMMNPKKEQSIIQNRLVHDGFRPTISQVVTTDGSRRVSGGKSMDRSAYLWWSLGMNTACGTPSNRSTQSWCGAAYAGGDDERLQAAMTHTATGDWPAPPWTTTRDLCSTNLSHDHMGVPNWPGRDEGRDRDLFDPKVVVEVNK